MICENCCSQPVCDNTKSKRCHEYFENREYLNDYFEDDILYFGEPKAGMSYSKLTKMIKEVVHD